MLVPYLYRVFSLHLGSVSFFLSSFSSTLFISLPVNYTLPIAASNPYPPVVITKRAGITLSAHSRAPVLLLVGFRFHGASLFTLASGWADFDDIGPLRGTLEDSYSIDSS